MSNISITESQLDEMLKKLSIESIEDLFKIIPNKFKYDINDLSLKDALSEQEITNYFNMLASKNLNSSNSLFFMGGGSYDHYVPKIVDTLSSRSEYYTAYTPYQAEVAQGTLQYLYEFQSMICSLSGMEVSNASLYDGASSLAEACSMSISITKNKKILLSESVHPSYVDVLKTYLDPIGIEIDLMKMSKDGTTECLQILEYDYACIVVQSPNYFGIVEDLDKYNKVKGNALFIVVSDPISISLLKSPGDCGCDIYVGEAQSLGNYMSFGGPNIGILASRKKFIRKMPGRIIGRTEDIDGKEAYSMVLQTREQHIRRDKATSNICTNQGLLALRSTIYLTLLGESLKEVAKICYNNCQYAADKINNLNNFNIFADNRSFIKEFIVTTITSATKIQKDAAENNILIDKPINDISDNKLLLAFTEKRTKQEIDSLIEFFKRYE